MGSRRDHSCPGLYSVSRAKLALSQHGPSYWAVIIITLWLAFHLVESSQVKIGAFWIALLSCVWEILPRLFKKQEEERVGDTIDKQKTCWSKQRQVWVWQILSAGRETKCRELVWMFTVVTKSLQSWSWRGDSLLYWWRCSSRKRAFEVFIV